MIHPGFPFRHRHAGGLAIAALLAGAARLCAQPAAVEEDIRGAKPPVEIPIPEKTPLALWAGIAAGVVLLLLAVWLWKKFRARRRPADPVAVALAALADLESTPDSMTAETFADHAAGTVRHYIAARFGLAAPRRTTEEFLRELAHTDRSPLAAEADPLRAFLKSCDLAKFAGSQLDATRRAGLLETARAFVRATAAPAPPASKP